jgi:hypothetical protein
MARQRAAVHQMSFQLSDRFHPLKNLVEVLEASFLRR